MQLSHSLPQKQIDFCVVLQSPDFHLAFLVVLFSSLALLAWSLFLGTWKLLLTLGFSIFLFMVFCSYCWSLFNLDLLFLFLINRGVILASVALYSACKNVIDTTPGDNNSLFNSFLGLLLVCQIKNGFNIRKSKTGALAKSSRNIFQCL